MTRNPFGVFATAALCAIALAGSALTAGAQVSPSELVVRLDRMENHLRQLTGTIEQLQHRNQQLEQQLRRMQEDYEFRFQELGGKSAAARPPAPAAAPRQPAQPPVAAQPPAPGAIPPPAPPAPAAPGRRSDAFDPNQNPNAPGAPQVLGSVPAGPPSSIIAEEDGVAPAGPPVGAPGGRQVGAPLDLSTLAAQATNDPRLAPPPPGAGTQVAAAPPAAGGLPPPPPRNPNATGVANAPPGGAPPTLAPSGSARDEYDLAYGYMLRKDYGLAEEGFRAFLKKHPGDRLVADAHYWLGESLFQRQQYRDAAESFLAVSTKYENAVKAPDALLRLGQSLAALGEKEAACATLGEIVRKYPRASGAVKASVASEQKRARC